MIQYGSKLICIEKIISNSCRMGAFLDEVEFSGDKTMLLLAACDYYILHRGGSFNFKED